MVDGLGCWNMWEKIITVGRQMEAMLMNHIGVSSSKQLVQKICEDLHYAEGTIENYFRKQPAEIFVEQLSQFYGVELQQKIVPIEEQLQACTNELLDQLEYLNCKAHLEFIEYLMRQAEKLDTSELYVDLKYIEMRARFNCGEDMTDQVDIYLKGAFVEGTLIQQTQFVTEILYMLITSNELDQAADVLKRYGPSIEMHENKIEDELLSFFYNQKGRLYMRSNKMIKARREFEKSLSLSSDPARRWKELTNIAITYRMMEKPHSYKNAIKYHMRALKTVKGFENKEMVARSFCNIAVVYLKLSRYEEAHKVIMQAVQNIDTSLTYGNELNIYDTLLDTALCGFKIKDELFSNILDVVGRGNNLYEYKHVVTDLLEKMAQYAIKHPEKIDEFIDKLKEIYENINSNIAVEIKMAIGEIFMVFVDYYRKGALKQ